MHFEILLYLFLFSSGLSLRVCFGWLHFMSERHSQELWLREQHSLKQNKAISLLDRRCNQFFLATLNRKNKGSIKTNNTGWVEVFGTFFSSLNVKGKGSRLKVVLVSKIDRACCSMIATSCVLCWWDDVSICVWSYFNSGKKEGGRSKVCDKISGCSKRRKTENELYCLSYVHGRPWGRKEMKSGLSGHQTIKEAVYT